MRLAIPPTAGVAEELPGALGGHPNQGAFTSTTQRTLHLPQGIWIQLLYFWRDTARLEQEQTILPVDVTFRTQSSNL